MTVLEAIKARHAVRSFTEKPIDGETIAALTAVIDECQSASGLSMQLVCDEPAAFDGMLAPHGHESTEIPLFSGGWKGERQGGLGLLYQDGLGYRPIPF